MVLKQNPHTSVKVWFHFMKYLEAMGRKKLTTCEKVKITKKMREDTLIPHYMNSICSEK
jgi:hypothetical protein